MITTDKFSTTYPVYKNANGNTYACGRADGEKNSAYQIKDGQISQDYANTVLKPASQLEW